MSVHERNIAELVASMAELLANPLPPPKRSIGFVPLDDKKDKLRTGKASRKAVGRKV